MLHAEYACIHLVTAFEGILFGNYRLLKGCFHMCNMSDVRLSNASPTLEKMDARQPDPAARPPICRNLFGTLDREEFQREVQARMHEGERAFAERWNFDVVNDRPLSPRNLKWEAVVAPGFYSRPPHRRRCPRGNVDCNCNDNRDDVKRDGGQSATDFPSTSLRKRPANRSGD